MATPSNLHTGTAAPAGFTDLLSKVARAAADAGVFAGAEISRGALHCPCIAPSAPAEYRVFFDANGGGKVWVGFFTADRWLSHSVEADLLHTGDKLGGLITEELVELGLEGHTLGEPEHFRDDAKQFTFRSPVPVAASDFGSPRSADLVTKYLLAYEAALRNIGDVDTRED